MSYTNLNIKKYTSDILVEESVETAAKSITMFLQDKIGTNWNTVIPKDFVYNTYEMVQEFNYTGPLALNKKYMKFTEFNEYTWDLVDTEQMYHIGGFFFGSFTESKLPYTNARETGIITDMLGASILAGLVKEDYSTAFAYLRMTQALLKLAIEDKQDVQNVIANKRKKTIKLNSF